MAKALYAARHSVEREPPLFEYGIRSRVDNWTFYLSPDGLILPAIDIGADSSHPITMFRPAAFHLKLPNKGTEVAGI